MQRLFSTTYPGDTSVANVSLLLGPSPATLTYCSEDFCNDELPPVLYNEAHVLIAHQGAFSRREVKEAVNSYLFELATSQDLDLEIVPRPSTDLWDDDDLSTRSDAQLRPLLSGKGLKEVIRHFLEGINSSSEREAFLSYAKVLEYVSATVTQTKSFEELLAKLNTPEALRPDADYLLELRALVERQREWKKDVTVHPLLFADVRINTPRGIDLASAA